MITTKINNVVILLSDEIFENFFIISNKKYPIDTPEHRRAAWSYFHMPRDYEKYSKEDRNIITNKIIKAWKDKISPDGPPSAK